MIILHGENQVASRQQLTAVKQGKQTVEFGTDVTLAQLLVATKSDSLFGGIKLAIVENLFSTRPSGEKKLIVEYLLKHKESDVVVWEGRDVSVKIREFDPQIVSRFDLPKYIFSFLDHPTVAGLQQVLRTMPAEQLLACLATRAHKQGKIKWLEELLQIDYKSKTGALPCDLAGALVVWCAKLNINAQAFRNQWDSGTG